MRKEYFLLGFILIFLMGLSPLSAQQDELISANPKTLENPQTSPGKISLDIKGMDIIDVLKILSSRANLNIIAGKNVRGRVTLFLKNVDVMDAFEIILAANGLAYEKVGDIINVMTDKDYELLYGEKSYDKKDVKILRLQYVKATDVGNSLKQIKSRIGKVVVDEGSNTIVLIDAPQKLAEMEEVIKSMDLATETKTFTLNYAKAEDLQGKIKSSLTRNVGEMKIDERMNKIMVTDLPEKLEYISRLIADFDERDQVVLIEAKIIQVSLNEDISYGINWNNVFAGIDTIAAADLSVSLPSGISAWPSTFTYTRVHGATDYGDRVILKLLEQLGRTDVLSTPRITVANNEEAKVLVGTKEAYVTSTITQSNGTTTTADNVQFVDVGVSLSVTPTISKDGYIMMKIKPEVSTAGTPLQLFNADGVSVRTSVPIVTTSEAETQLLVKDGATIIMAGLMKDTRTDNTEKIPLLGDIPILGHFFKSRGKGDEKTELVIFLTPHILKEGDDSLAEAEEYLYRHEATAMSANGRPAIKPRTLQPETEEAESAEPEAAMPSPQAEEAVSLEAQEVSLESLFVAEEMPRPKDFDEYCSYVSDKINQSLALNIPQCAGGQQVSMSFMITSEGLLKERPRVLTLTDEKVKDTIIKSIEQASPFFPFPDDYREPVENFKLTVHFEDNGE